MCAVYWPHPAVWWVARRLRVERELACDDRVLRAGTEARDYAGHLLEIAYDLGGFRAPSLAVSMARPGQLEGRMLAVLDAARNRAMPGRRARLVGTVAAAATLLPLAVFAVRAEPLSAEIDDLSSLESPARVTEPSPPRRRHMSDMSSRTSRPRRPAKRSLRRDSRARGPFGRRTSSPAPSISRCARTTPRRATVCRCRRLKV